MQARLLGIEAIPGGPPLERLAASGDPRAYALPRPLSRTRDEALRSNCDFSYAGLKSAVRMLLEPQQPPKKQRKQQRKQQQGQGQQQQPQPQQQQPEQPPPPQQQQQLPAPEPAVANGDGGASAAGGAGAAAPDGAATPAGSGGAQRRADIAASFQRVAVEHLVERVERAIGWAREAEPGLTCVVVAGGVAANGEVRRQLSGACGRAGLPMVCPPVRLCTDNGTMVAWAGMLRLWLGLAEPPLRESDELDLFVEVRPKWPIGPRDRRSTTQAQQLAKRKTPAQASAAAEAAGYAPAPLAAPAAPAGGSAAEEAGEKRARG